MNKRLIEDCILKVTEPLYFNKEQAIKRRGEESFEMIIKDFTGQPIDDKIPQYQAVATFSLEKVIAMRCDEESEGCGLFVDGWKFQLTSFWEKQ